MGNRKRTMQYFKGGFVEYYEMHSGMFGDLNKTYPAGTLTVEQLKVELEKACVWTL